MKKILSFCLVLLMIFSSVPLSGNLGSLFTLEVSAAEIVDSGSFGSLQWSYDDEGTLTISGEGKMVAQQYFEIPWFTKRAELKTVIIEDGVQNIGNFAFQNCTELTSVTVPTSVTAIEKSAFEGCSSFGTIYYAGAESQWNEIEIGTDNDSLINATKSFAIIEGICGDNLYWVFDESTGTLTISGEGDMNNYAYDNVPWLAYKTDIKTAVIESGVTSIGDYAFNGCTNLSSVTIPEGVENIGESAFRSCTSLQTVTFPDSIRNIYDSAFRNCTGFTDINLPDGLLTIGNSCFYACTGLTSIAIPGTVTKISFEAFYCCENLESVIIFDGVETIGEDAFAGCLALTSVTIPTSVTCIEEYAFSYSDAIEPVYYGGSESQWNKITIGSNNPVLSAATKVFAVVEGICGNNLTWSLNKNTGILTISGEGDMYSYFMDAPWMSYTDSINTVIVENGVTSISSFAFYNCANITSVTLPDTLEEICDNSFYNCTDLTGITIPDSVSIIYSAAFAGSGITEIVIPDGIEEIAGSTFANCKNLTTVTIPDSVTGIGANAFNGCDALQTVYYGGSKSQWNAISIGTDNDALTNATKVFAVIEVTPAEDSDGDGYVEIDTAEKLWWFTQQVNGGNNSLNAELTTNIDLFGTCGADIGNWQPIGNKYSGHFNGQGFTISNLYIESDEQYAGLFGYVRGGTIENVTVTGNVSSTFYSTYDENYNFYDGAAGGVVANLDGGTIRNCESTVTVTGGYHFGGICGRLSSGIIEDCINRGTIICVQDSTDIVDYGGIVGYLNEGTVRGCINHGEVTVGTRQNYVENVGGIVGRSDTGTIENCINMSSIVGSYTSTGGIVGKNWVYATVSNCGNLGTVTGDYAAGGITGLNEGNIEHCWNIASVSGTSENVGPIAGLDREGYGTSTNCYYLSDTETNDGGRTVEQFASGQVAYELNGSTTTDESVWKQTLGTDIYPTFTGASVYYNTTKNCDGTVLNSGYSNSSENIVIHDLSYTASDNIITETCGYDGCTHSAAATLNAPENAVYYGESNAATITYSNGWCGGELTVTYSGTANDGTEYTGVPVKAGEAVASVTIDDVTASINYTVAKATNEWIEAPSIDGWTYGEDYNDPTATAKFGDYRDLSFSYRVKGTIAWTNNTPSDAGIYEMRTRVQATDNWELLETTIEFEIKKATTTVDIFDFTAPTNLNVCDGLAKEATVTVKEGIEGVGSVTVKYFKGETELASAPTAVGTYTVKIDVAEGANYNAAENITVGTFTYDIPDEAEHTGVTFVSNENGTHDKICTVCEKVLEDDITCVYAENIDDKFIEFGATCVSGTTYYKSCDCGRMSDETFIAGATDPDTHTGTSEKLVSDNAGKHSVLWTCCKAVAEENVVCSPIIIDDDCTTAEICACGYVIKNAKSHSFDNVCDTDCNNVGCNHTRTITHTPNEDDGDCTTPIHCSICDTITTEGRTAHTGGEATCSAQAKCEVCGTTHGEYSSIHNNTTVINASSATCGTDGYTGDIYCNDCEQTVDKGEIIIATGHTDENNDGICDICNEQFCTCRCHKTGIVKFFWNILNFFQKLFGYNKICPCGKVH